MEEKCRDLGSTANNNARLARELNSMRATEEPGRVAAHRRFQDNDAQAECVCASLVSYRSIKKGSRNGLEIATRRFATFRGSASAKTRFLAEPQKSIEETRSAASNKRAIVQA